MRKAVIPVLLLTLLACAGCIGRTRLRSFDELIAAGQNARLRAKLERGGFLFLGRDVEGAEIRFEVLHAPKTAEQKKPVYHKLCDSFTDSDGTASADIEGFFEGMHLIRATYLGTSGVISFSRVYAVKRDTPILVCDIDHTIADVSALNFLSRKPEEIPALPGAVEALTKLSGKYLIVYLTARDDSFLDVTIRWLVHKKFPQGPVFFSDLSKTAFTGSARDFKSARLAAWKKAGLNLQVGVGDKVGDIAAYIENGMQAFSVVDKSRPTSSEAAGCPWSEIAEMLLK